jgi:hypothetical protein
LTVVLPLKEVWHVHEFDFANGTPDLGSIFYWEPNFQTNMYRIATNPWYAKTVNAGTNFRVKYSNGAEFTRSLDFLVNAPEVWWNRNDNPLDNTAASARWGARPFWINPPPFPQGNNGAVRNTTGMPTLAYPNGEGPQEVRYYYRGYFLPAPVKVWNVLDRIIAEPKDGNSIAIDMSVGAQDNDNINAKRASTDTEFANLITVTAWYSERLNPQSTTSIELTYNRALAHERRRGAHTAAPTIFDVTVGMDLEDGLGYAAGPGDRFDRIRAVNYDSDRGTGEPIDPRMTMVGAGAWLPGTTVAERAASALRVGREYTMNFGELIRRRAWGDPLAAPNTLATFVGDLGWGTSADPTYNGTDRTVTIWYYAPAVSPIGPYTRTADGASDTDASLTNARGFFPLTFGAGTWQIGADPSAANSISAGWYMDNAPAATTPAAGQNVLGLGNTSQWQGQRQYIYAGDPQKQYEVTVRWSGIAALIP